MRRTQQFGEYQLNNQSLRVALAPLAALLVIFVIWIVRSHQIESCMIYLCDGLHNRQPQPRALHLAPCLATAKPVPGQSDVILAHAWAVVLDL